MHLPFILIVLLTLIVAIVSVTLCLWLSLKIFGLKPDRSNLTKIVAAEMLFTVVTSLPSLVTKDEVAAMFNLLSLVGSFVLWFVLLKRFAASRYSIGRAIGSYITSYILILVLALLAAIMFVALFAQVFKIDGDSMAPAFRANNTVLVYKFEKHPKDNSVVVYRTKTSARALGRVHGTPGQSVSIPSGRVEVQGNIQNASSYTLSSSQYYVTYDNATYNIPPRIINNSDIIGTIGPKL